MNEREVIVALILRKLVNANVWGGKHTPWDFIKKAVPEHYRNTHKGNKEIEGACKDLLNNGWIILIAKRTGRGSDVHVSLNPRKVSEIKQFLEKQR